MVVGECLAGPPPPTFCCLACLFETLEGVCHVL
nr:MAG TPA: hypothetical protein [Caudoviricetes sp.]